MQIERVIWGVLFLWLNLLMTSCFSGDDNQPNTTVTVFAAASLTDAFREIGAAFEAAHPTVQVTFNFAGSQQLAQQLTQGAPGDVFASADMRQMEVVVENGRIQVNNAHSFATNQLIVVYPIQNPGNIFQLADLARPGVKVILATGAVPVGAYSQSFLQKASQASALGNGFETAVLNNVVSYEQSVRAVYSKITLGEADAGIVYASDVARDGETAVSPLVIPAEFNIIAHYPIATIADSANPKLAAEFVQFVLSTEGQTILEKHRFLPIKYTIK
ncbi:MAG: molybdate ABC transporter substrate-binding protein [Chloroflexi bacterium]|nr:molybdate ABC transporter substrate-binding protein [Chloroflexota bacterium]